jgi:hypothetical protein
VIGLHQNRKSDIDAGNQTHLHFDHVSDFLLSAMLKLENIMIPSDEKRIIVTVHGIRTFGRWQRRLEQLVKHEDDSIQFFHFEYGYFSLIAFIIPITRWLLVRRFQRELRAIVDRHQPTRLDLVGHSFGTHLIAWALNSLKKHDKIKVHTILFAGSVLRADFYWANLIPSRVKRVINDCGASDGVLLASQFLVLFTGMAGRTGFVGMNGPEFVNRYSTFGHSGYFQDRRGRNSDHYMQLRWVPLLIADDVAQQFDERNAPTPWRGAVIWLSNNFEPIKLTMVTAPLLIGFIWISALYIEAVAMRERMRATVALGDTMRDKGATPLSPDTEGLLNTLQTALRIGITRKTILWVDDGSENTREKKYLAEFGFCFESVNNTDAAMQKINANPKKYSVVISDFMRDQDPKQGYVLLDELKASDAEIPLIYYVGQFTEAQAADAKRRGAQAEVRGAIDLLREVFRAVNPQKTSAGRVELIVQRVLGCRGENNLLAGQ